RELPSCRRGNGGGLLRRDRTRERRRAVGATGSKSTPRARSSRSARDAVLKGRAMTILAWILVGLAVGYVAGIHEKGRGLRVRLLLGAFGAACGGLLFHTLESEGHGFDVWSVVAASFGAILVLGTEYLFAIDHHLRA